MKYDGGGFWLTINDIEGYFDFNNNIGFLEIIFKMRVKKVYIIKYGIEL